MFDRVGGAATGATVLEGLIVNVHATPQIADNDFVGGGWIRAIGSSAAVIEGNVLRDGPRIELVDPAEGSVIRGNSIMDAGWVPIGVYGQGSPIIEDNVIEGADTEAITIGELGFYAIGTNPVVRNNTITGTVCGITVANGAAPLIESNRLSVSEFGLVFESPSTAKLVGNDIQLADGAMDIVEGLENADPEGDGFCEVEEAA
jgi:hypothetical protein